MSVHRDKRNNTWYVKYQNRTKRGFKTKFEAQKHEAKLRLEDNSKNTPYFNDVALDYLKYLKGNVSYATSSKHEAIVKKVILPNFINKDMNTIKEMDCRNFRDYIQDLDYSTLYKNYILQQFKAIFKHAEKYFELKRNPTHLIDPFKKTYEERKRTRDKELNIWTDEEFAQFIRFVKRERYKQLFILLYYTGLRLGEALALTWKDFKDGKIMISKSITKITQNGEHLIKDPKNVSSIRDISLGSTLEAFLASFKRSEMEVAGFSEDWFIFGRIKPLGRSQITRVKDEATEKAGLRKIRIHDFRHSHASNLIANGMNIVAVSKRLGHSDVNMTLKIYTHLIKKNEEELTDYIDSSSQKLLDIK